MSYQLVVSASNKKIISRAKMLADEREYSRGRLAHINGKSYESWVDYFIEALDDLGARIQVIRDDENHEV
jgi:hypothetical protein